MLQVNLAWFVERTRTFRTTHAIGEPGLVSGALKDLQNSTCYREKWLGLMSVQGPSEQHMLQVFAWFDERIRNFRTTHATGKTRLVWGAYMDVQSNTFYRENWLGLMSAQGPSEEQMPHVILAWFVECTRTFRTTYASGEPGLVWGASKDLQNNTFYRWTWLGLRSAQGPSELHMLQMKLPWFEELLNSHTVSTKQTCLVSVDGSDPS